MKIALTLYNANFLGGGNKFTAELAQMLLKKGHQVALCAANKPESGKCHNTLLDFDPIFTAEPFRPLRKAKLYISSFLVSQALRRCIDRFRPEVIINADAPPATFSLIKRKDVRLVQYVHWPTELQSYRHSIFLEFYRALYWGLHYKALKKLDAVVCNSNYTRQVTHLMWYREVPSDKFHVAYPPVDVELFKKMKASRREMVSCIGRLDPNKGIDMVIDAFLKVQDEFPELTLTIAGALNKGDLYTSCYYPKLKTRLEMLNNPRISLLVNPSDEEIIRLYKSSKCFANFNPGEHFGICAIESQAAGAIPIVARGGGQLETVHHEKTGFLVESPNEMVESIRKVFSSIHRYRKMSQNAVTWSETFSLASFERSWSEIFKKL